MSQRKRPYEQDYDSATKRTRGDGQSCVLFVGQLPAHWTQENINSIIAGSGPILDIRSRLQPANPKKSFCFVEYYSPEDAVRAMDMLNDIPSHPFRVEMSKDALRSDGKRASKVFMELTRDNLPSDFPVSDLPREMLEAVPLPQWLQKQIEREQQMRIPIPEILTKASQHLPPLDSKKLTMDDKVSENLSKVAPAQVIELVANLKTLINQQGGQSTGMEAVLNANPGVAVAVGQALMAMGFIDMNVIQTTMTQQAQESQQQQYGQQQYGQQQYGQHNQQSSYQEHNYIKRESGNLESKLQTLPADQAQMIRQVLAIPENQIGALPQEQQAMIYKIRSDYL